MPSRRKTEPSTKQKNLPAESTSALPTLRARNAPGKSSQSIKKIDKPRRTSPRLQERLLNTLSSLDPPQEPSNEYDDQTGNPKRIRGRECEKKPSLPPENPKKARLANSARMSVSAVGNKPQPLTVNNLKRHTLREGYLDKLELINSEADKDCWSRSSEGSAAVVETETGSTST